MGIRITSSGQIHAGSAQRVRNLMENLDSGFCRNDMVSA